MTYEERAASMSVNEVATALAERDAQHARIDDLETQLAFFRRQLFGPRSERRAADPAQQLFLGEVGKAPPAPAQDVEVPAHRRRSRRSPAGEEASPVRFDDRVPVETIEVPAGIPAAELDQYTVIGTKETCRLAQRPGAYVVLRYVRKVFKRKGSDGEISCPPAPASVLEKSAVDVSFLAGLAIDKLSYHLPLHRQHQRLSAAGVHLGRSTLTTYIQRMAELLEPIYEAQLRSIVASQVLAMDETPIRAGRRKRPPPGRGKMKTGYYWPLYGDKDEVAFPFAPTRAYAVVAETLKGFCGTLLTDGYEAYARFAARTRRVELAHCWAHARRGFVEAEAVEPQLAGDALDRIAALYRHEDRCRAEGITGDALGAYRREHAAPLVDALIAWLSGVLEKQALLPTNLFTKAARYVLDREASLRVFLENPDVPIDTNHLERALRTIAIGRKNWLFCSTEAGARQLGILQSLLATCRLQGVDAYTYLVDVLQRVDTHPANDVEALTPRIWKTRFADDPMRSDLDRVTHLK